MKGAKKSFTIVGNWKMNPDTLSDAKEIFSRISRKAKKAHNVSTMIAPPAAYLVGLPQKGAVSLAAQDVSEKQSGAFTGSISARQMKSAGATLAIVGHSERRAAGDTDTIIADKVKQALDAQLKVILCVGEKERDNEARYLHTVREQLVAALSAVDKSKARWISIAYEPVWAIGKSYDTALKASDIYEMTIYIKKVAAEIFGKTLGLKMLVLYGGSVNFENAQAILSEGGVDGLLVGRQSLDPEAFGNMIDYANKI